MTRPYRNRSDAIVRFTARIVLAAVVLPLLIVALAAGMTGCASLQQGVQAYGSVAVTGAQATNDTIIEAQKVTFCGLPYSAIVRHPEIIPAIKSLCVPAGDVNGAALLDAAVK